MKQKAFTLIELLVVIFIIAILAAILFPVLSQARQSAKKINDLSNIKQISLAMQMYSSDNDELTLVKDEDEGYEWYPSLYPYVKNRDVFKTPAYKSSIQDYPTDYIINGLFAHGIPLTTFSEPASQINIVLRQMDVGDTDYHPWPNDSYSWDNLTMYNEDEEDWFEERIFKKAFFNGSNYSFADGHVKFHVFEKTLLNYQYPGMHNVDRIAVAHEH